MSAAFKVCAMVLLVLAKLIAGPTAHAMLHAEPSGVREAPAHEEAPCPEHLVRDPAPVTGDAPTDSEAPHAADCCKGSACECACAGGFTFLGTTHAVSLALMAEDGLASLPLPPASHQLAALFRPPA